MDGQEFHAENTAPDAGTTPAVAQSSETSSSTPSPSSGDEAMERAYANAMSKRGFKSEPETGKERGSEGQGNTAQPSGGASPTPTTTEPPAERGENGGEPAKGKAGTGETDAERRARNRQQAAMRIARKQERQRLYQEELERLSREKEAFEQEGDDQNPTMAQVKEDQIRELQIQMVREMQEEWQREAREMFTPEDAEQFLADSKKYSDWINKNEPELRQYINKPYGRYLLKGWFDKIAKNPENADRWEAMNPYQRYQMLEKNYRELEKFGEDFAAGKVKIGVQGEPQQTAQPSGAQPTQQAQPAQPQNVPVPGSGRNTDNEPPTDDINLLIDRAMNKRKAALHH